jgi:ABC-type transport system involved in cytochrome c biogenesis permease subunit
MRFGLGVLALLVVATVPAFIVAGGTSLRGLGWLLVIGAAVVVLIDFTDRVTDWIERRRWGRRR